MAYWLRDPQASRVAQRHIFRLPYPGGTWLAEKKRNQGLLFLMEEAYTVASVGFKNKKGKKLNKQEEKILEKVAEHL